MQYRHIPEKSVCVQLRHNTYSGHRFVIVDGIEERSTQGTSSVISLRGNGADVMKVSLDKGIMITVRIALMSNFGFSYRCDMDGTILKEANEIIGEEIKESYESNVLSTEVVSNVKGEGVVWYHVQTTRASDGKVSSRSRRFKEFYELSDDVHSAFVGNHLVNDLPKLPSRGIKYFSDHLDPLFVERRRMQLHTYLRALEKIPRVSRLPQYLSFIGMGKGDSPSSPSNSSYIPSSITDSTLRPGDFNEFSFEFGEGSLGITLKNTSSKIGSAVVDGYNQNPDGSLGAAETGGVVGIGDIISRINGISVTTSSYDEVIAIIKNAKRPCVIHFLRKRGSNPPKPRLSDTPIASAPHPPLPTRAFTSTKDEEEGLFS